MPRLEAVPVDRLPVRAKPAGSRSSFAVGLTEPGSLDNFVVREAPMPVPGPGELLVEVGAVGLNFRDILAATGLLPDELDGSAAWWRNLGFELAGFVMIGLRSQAEPDLRAFENRLLGWPLVREAYMMSGETDYMLKCVAPDLTAFREFVDELTAAPNVASVKTAVAIRRAKLEPGVPLTVAGARPQAT